MINSNGLALTDELLTDLVGAGLSGFTFHIDSTQGRPKWKGAREEDLNQLRLGFATRVHDAGNVSVAFNSTITADTLKSVPALVSWAGKHIDIVHGIQHLQYRVRGVLFALLGSGLSISDMWTARAGAPGSIVPIVNGACARTATRSSCHVTADEHGNALGNRAHDLDLLEGRELDADQG